MNPGDGLKPGDEILSNYADKENSTYVEEIIDPPKYICKSCFEIYSQLLSTGTFDRPNMNMVHTEYCQVCKSLQDCIDNPFTLDMVWYTKRKKTEGLPAILEYHKNNTIIRYDSDKTILKFAGSLYLNDLSILMYGLSFVDNTENVFEDIRFASPKEISLFRKSLKLDKLA